MGKSWKSTVSAVISVAGLFVIFASGAPYNVHFPVWLSALADFMALGGLAGLGINAKDAQVTGGSIVQPGVPVAPVPTAVQGNVQSVQQTPVVARSTSTVPPKGW